MKATRICSFNDCKGRAIKVGLCSGHYKMRRRGEELRPLRPYVRGTPAERLLAWSHEDQYGCLVWDGHTYPNGYGRIRVDGAVVLTHRLAYETWVGPIPDGLEIDHLCRNRVCIRPNHLEAVTRTVNLLRQTRYRLRNELGQFI